MTNFMTISEVSKHYQISSRTLRFYEEKGLIASERDENSNYRVYSHASIRQLEQILILRQLGLSVVEIQNIFESKEPEFAISIINNKINTLSTEVMILAKQKDCLETIMQTLEQKKLPSSLMSILDVSSKILGFEKNKLGVQLVNSNETGLKSNEVRLIELKPMRVACYRAYSASPEDDAFNNLFKWTLEMKLDELSTTRYFGFDNPSPDGVNPVYGYEVWVTIPDNIQTIDISTGIEIKMFEGGLFAVTCTSLDTFDVGERWQKLVQWVNNSEFEILQKQYLEEHISPKPRWEARQLQLDLYLAIKQCK